MVKYAVYTGQIWKAPAPDRTTHFVVGMYYVNFNDTVVFCSTNQLEAAGGVGPAEIFGHEELWFTRAICQYLGNAAGTTLQFYVMPGGEGAQQIGLPLGTMDASAAAFTKIFDSGETLIPMDPRIKSGKTFAQLAVTNVNVADDVFFVFKGFYSDKTGAPDISYDPNLAPPRVTVAGEVKTVWPPWRKP